MSSQGTPERETRFNETLVEVSPTAIVTCDPTLHVTARNPAAERLFGWTREEAIGHHIDDLVAQHDAICDEATSLNAHVLGGPTELVTRRSRKDGTLVGVSIRSVPIVLDGELVGAFALYEDVGELVDQRRFFESLVESSPTAIIMVNRDVVVTLWNPAAERLFGYTADEAIGENLDDLVAKDRNCTRRRRRGPEEAWGRASFRRIGSRTRKDGSLVDVEILAIREEQEDQPSGFYILYHHVTDLEHTRRRLEARIDEQVAELVRTGELAWFLPRQVVESLMEGGLPTDAETFERRRITVLFADMVGFTDLAESLEPEELADVLNGYPGDERRRDRVRWLGRQPDRRRRDGRVRSTEGDALGFAVNVAARLETAAEPGSVLCGFRAYALVKDRVKAETRGELSVKGARRPVEAWEIVDLLEASES